MQRESFDLIFFLILSFESYWATLGAPKKRTHGEVSARGSLNKKLFQIFLKLWSERLICALTPTLIIPDTFSKSNA